MAKSSLNHALVWVSLAGALAGCSTVPDSQRPAANPPIKIPDAAGTSDEPVPQAEPPSRSGNPDTYVVFGRRYRVKETSEGYREQGLASWYGRAFHGRKTASGPPYNMFDLTAAHKSLPIPTYARVTNLENGRSTVVKINDRGPFVGRRLIDLSYAAAERLGMLHCGTAPVEVAAVAPYQILPKLAARRAEQRELLASRAMQAKPKAETAEIEFARLEPIQPTTQTSSQPPEQVLASLEQNPPQVKAPVRLALADGERRGPKAVAKTSVQRAQANDEQNPPQAKAPVRLVLADGGRNALSTKAPVRLAQADVKRAAAKASAKVPVRLTLADVKRTAPKAVAKTANLKLAKVEDDRNPGRTSIRPPSAAPAPKGREAVAKPPLPATPANRNGKPVPARQASESGPMAVRLASLKINRPRGVAD